MAAGAIVARDTVICLSSSCITAGLLPIAPQTFGQLDHRALSSFRVHAEPGSPGPGDASGIVQMQIRFQNELRKRHAITEHNIDAAKALYLAYHGMTERM
jgi:hypothetical protein